MKQDKLIKQLTLLKKVQPNNTVIDNIQKDLHSRFNRERNIFGSRTDTFRFSTHGYLVGFAILFAIVITAVMIGRATGFPNEIIKEVAYTKIAISSNQYEKAQIALSYAQNILNEKNSLVDRNDFHTYSDAIALANKQLSGLKLKGEKGKYSAKQCRELYSKYYTFLNKAYSQISSLAKKKSYISQLHQEISVYKNQAQYKLDLYKK